MSNISRTLVGVFAIALGILSIGLKSASAQTFGAYISAPTDLATSYGTAITNTFDNASFFPTTGFYNSDVTVTGFGTYKFSTTTAKIIPTDGANDSQYGNNTGNYLGVGQAWGSGSNSLTIELTASVHYFGFAWDAGDSGDTIDFYDGNTLLTSYSTSNVTSVLSGQTVTAIDNTVYQTSGYKGQPVTGLNANENYTYLNFITTGRTFNKIVMRNPGAGFESDNHSINFADVAPAGAFVPAGTAIIPEPGTLALMLLPLCTGLVVRARRRTR